MMTIIEACEILRVDQGPNDAVINKLLAAIPGYITGKTGYIEGQHEEAVDMVELVSGFILQQWYFTDSADDLALGRLIDSTLGVISAIVTAYRVGALKAEAQ